MISISLIAVVFMSVCNPSATAIGVNVDFNLTWLGVENITAIMGLTSPPVDPSIAEDAKSTTVHIFQMFSI